MNYTQIVIKKCIITLVVTCLYWQVQAQSTYDIFNYKAPTGFSLKESNDYLFYSKTECKIYCQMFLNLAAYRQADIKKVQQIVKK